MKIATLKSLFFGSEVQARKRDDRIVRESEDDERERERESLRREEDENQIPRDVVDRKLIPFDYQFYRWEFDYNPREFDSNR